MLAAGPGCVPDEVEVEEVPGDVAEAAASPGTKTANARTLSNFDCKLPTKLASSFVIWVKALIVMKPSSNTALQDLQKSSFGNKEVSTI